MTDTEQGQTQTKSQFGYRFINKSQKIVPNESSWPFSFSNIAQIICLRHERKDILVSWYIQLRHFTEDLGCQNPTVSPF